MNYLAIDVGGTFVKYGVITEECLFLTKGKIPTQKDSLEEFLNMLFELYEKITAKYKIEGIGLSMPGLIDSKNGFMYTGGFVECISNLNIVEVMEKKCGVAVTVENDAKCAALAELWKGSLKECSNAIVLVCGTGVGGAVIQNRSVITGNQFVAGEFSFMLTDYDADYVSKNCLAETSGIGKLLQFVADETGIPVKKLNGEKAFSMANCGDEKAIRGIRRYVRHIAVQIHNCRCMFDPEKIAIGGGISEQPLFLQLINEELQEMYKIFPWKVAAPKVVVCQFHNDANLIGAIYVHLKSKEKQFSSKKLSELLELMGNRREVDYLKELLME